MKVSRTTCSASIDVSADASLPTELLVFRPGLNQSSKGPFTFDALAAASVMRAYEVAGTDVMIDREHDSLDENARAMRADAGDAMGWGKLELRVDGSLWMVGVTWGAEGEKRLREKRQRYLSPAFTTDEDGRPLELVNVGLVARPALCDAPALVAASRSAGVSRLTCYAVICTALAALSTRAKTRRI